MSEKLRVLGIDPGLANLGLGVIEGDPRKAICLHHQTVVTPPKQDMSERLLVLFEATSALLAEFSPQAVAIEEQFLGRQAGTSFKVGQAFGVVLLACVQANVPVHGYGPMAVKQALVGTGRADKTQVIYMVKASLGLRNLSNNHAADALALALTHLSSLHTSKLR